MVGWQAACRDHFIALVRCSEDGSEGGAERGALTLEGALARPGRRPSVSIGILRCLFMSVWYLFVICLVSRPEPPPSTG